MECLVISMFTNKKRSWPKVDSCSDVQSVIDVMCAEYEVPPIKVIVKSTNSIYKYN